jgi:hypothetical protein
MNRARADDPLLGLSVRAYRLLLWAYPAHFRREYGPHMLQVFGDRCRRARRRGGAAALLAWWAITLLDYARSLAEQRLNRETTMSKEYFVRLSGWLLVLGALAFHVLPFAYLASGDDYWPRLGEFEAATIAGYFYGPVAMALGLVGLWLRYRHATSAFAQGALLLGASGGVVMIVGNVGQAFEPDPFWKVHTAGMFLTHAGLALFGLATRPRILGPRPVVLALLAGLPMLIAGLLQMSAPGTSLGLPGALAVAAGAAGWVALGAGLLLEKREAMALA